MSRATDTKVETIRWYEKAGLLPRPARTGGNYRIYGSQELVRLQFIRRARDLGFSLDQVRKLLSLSGDAQTGCASVHDTARDHIEEVDRKIANLTTLRQELAQLSETCTGGATKNCGILEALVPAQPTKLVH
ncbi:MAG: helix-turn-helix domain-containing protein [Pseudomonadota bacterium]